MGGDIEDPGFAVLRTAIRHRFHANAFCRRRPGPTQLPSRRTSRRRSAWPTSTPRSTRRRAGCAAVRPPTAGPPAARLASSRGSPRGPARPRRCGRGSPERTTRGSALRCRRSRPGWRPPRRATRRPWDRPVTVSMADRAALAASRSAVEIGRAARRRGGRCGRRVVVDRRGEARGCPLPPLHQFGFDQPGDAPGGHPERGRRQLAGGHRCHPVHQVVRLVDHQQRSVRAAPPSRRRRRWPAARDW